MKCNQCPRKCGSSRLFPNNSIQSEAVPYCGKSEESSLFPFAKAMQHMWEEPCISGVNGSGAIFFSGCNLGCSFCQNYEISNSKNKKKESVRSDWLENELFRLKDLGCHNIDFITGSHIVAELLPVMQNAIQRSIQIPFVWNSSAYETEAQIRALEPYIDIYMPDLKFFDPDLSTQVAGAPDYFEAAGKAVIEMLRQRSKNKYHVVGNDLYAKKNTMSKHEVEENDDINTARCHDNNNKDVTIINNNIYDSNRSIIDRNISINNIQTTIMDRGVLIRHLVLPGFYKDSIKILQWMEANLSTDVSLSLLSQYIPDYYEKGCQDHNRAFLPSLGRKLTSFEYEKVVDKAIALGFHDVFIQKRESADPNYIPKF